jgi:flavin-dependent dehydrogenase
VKADLLVIGGGMAGLAAAARAVEAGASVLVVEKGAELGGSAALSAGILWTAPDFATLRRVVPGGDPDLGRALVTGFEPAVRWIRSTGAFVSEQWEGQMGSGRAVRVDVAALLDPWRRQVEGAGSIRLRTSASRLLTGAGGRVRGTTVAGPAGAEEVEAGALLLATGGFQGDRELRAPLAGTLGRWVLGAVFGPRAAGAALRVGVGGTR